MSEDKFLVLTERGAFRLPNLLMPPLMSNHGNYIVSLGALCIWLGEQAAELGVEIYPGFAAAEVLYDENGAVVGVATGDMGVGRDGKPTDSFMRGMELRGKYTFFAEGARGSLTKQLIKQVRPRRRAQPQKYGIGLKELWQVKPGEAPAGPRAAHASAGRSTPAPAAARSSTTTATTSWRSASSCTSTTRTPTCRPTRSSSASRRIPPSAPRFEGGKRIGYGARALTEGGWQSIPRARLPRRRAVGCAAGFMNVPRIKGSHNAILSGIAAAEAAFAAIGEGRAHDRLEAYERTSRSGDIAQRLEAACATPSRCGRGFGTYLGIVLGGIDMWLNTILPGIGLGITLKHGKPDYATLEEGRRAPSRSPIPSPTAC